MALAVVLLLCLGIVATGATAFSWFVKRLEVDNGTLDDGTTPALRYRVPTGLDAGEVVVNLQHHGYHVTARYEHGDTNLYIATKTGTADEREQLRALIRDADEVEHEDFRPPALVWHPESVRFADET